MPTEMGADAHDAADFAKNASAFSGQGYGFVAQYIDRFGDANTAGSPSVTLAQVQQERSAGLQIMSIFQTNGMSSSTGTAYQTYFTAAQGTQDAAEAMSSARSLDQPAGSSIYFAMDFDPAIPGAAGSEKQLLTSVQTYLSVVNQAFQGSGYTIGVYGAGDTLAAAIRNSPGSPNYNPAYTPVAVHGWLTQSYGWAGSNPQTDANAMGWDVYQGPQTTVNGVAIDPDTAQNTAFGQWTLCFAAGTSIRTTRGDVTVELLQVGDLVVTASGSHRPVTWLGRRVLECAGHPAPHEVWPVRIRAGAFGVGLCGGGVPARDLSLSPGHPVLVDDGAAGVLVPVMCLINGTTVARAPVDRVTYWHVELDAHDILLAEGLPAESYLDGGSRAWFDAASTGDDEGRSDDRLTSPDLVAPDQRGRCRAVAVAGPIVERERRRLDAVFAAGLAAQCAWPDADEVFPKA